MRMKNSTLAEKARRFMEIKAQMDILDAEAEDLRAEMLKEMNVRKKDVIQLDGMTLTKGMSSRTNLDKIALEAAHPGLLEKFQRVTTFPKFSVK